MRKRGKFGKAALLVGAAAMAAGVLLKRDKVAGLLPSRSGGATQDTGWAPAPAPAPAPSNYDAPGPVANTATPVPAPEPQVLGDEGAIDEQAEEAAAAAEAANIGGPVADYAGIDEPSLSADEADRPLVEAGQGSSEGQELAEAALADAAAPTAPGESPYERQIDEVIEQASQPGSGERVEAIAPVEDAPGDAELRAAEAAAAADMAAAEATPVPDPPPPPAPDLSATPSVPQPDPAPAPEPISAPEPDIAPAPEPVPAPEPAAEVEPAGEVPFGTGTTADVPGASTPGAPATEEPWPGQQSFAEPGTADVVETPASPSTAGSWQPPAPPAPPAPEPPAAQEPPPAPEAPAAPGSPESAAPTEEQPLPADDSDDDGNDWKTWSGGAVRP